LGLDLGRAVDVVSVATQMTQTSGRTPLAAPPIGCFNLDPGSN